MFEYVLDLDYFHAFGDAKEPAIDCHWTRGDGNFVLCLGENASGKSFFRRLVTLVCRKANVEAIPISMEGRGGDSDCCTRSRKTQRHVLRTFQEDSENSRPSADQERRGQVTTNVKSPCDCCSKEVNECVEVPWIEIVDVRPKATAAEVHAAPRHLARWCRGCVNEHARWMKSQRREPQEARIVRPNENVAAKHLALAPAASSFWGSADDDDD